MSEFEKYWETLLHSHRTDPGKLAVKAEFREVWQASMEQVLNWFNDCPRNEDGEDYISKKIAGELAS